MLVTDRQRQVFGSDRTRVKRASVRDRSGRTYQSAISTFESGGHPSVSFRAVDAEAVARVLAGAPVFSALSEAERKELVPHLRGRRFSRDEVVFHRDDPAGHLYVILTGSVKVSIPDEEGHEVVVAVPGRVAKCLLDLATAHARTEVELTQDDLAAFVGATRVSVNRALADLESQGAIAVGRRHIAVKEPALLRKQVRY